MNILELRRHLRGLGVAAAVAALLTVVVAPSALAGPLLESSTRAPSASAVGAPEQTGVAAASGEEPLKAHQELRAHQEQAAADEDSGSGPALWVFIIVGLLVGVGIGFGIVLQAKRKHRAAGGRE